MFNTETLLALVNAFYNCFEKGCPTKAYATMPKGIIDSVGLPTVDGISRCFALTKGKMYNEYLYLWFLFFFPGKHRKL